MYYPAIIPIGSSFFGWYQNVGVPSTDWYVRALTCGLFGITPATVVPNGATPPPQTPSDQIQDSANSYQGGNPEVQRYIYALPLNRADRNAGRVCTYTGFWAPGHMIVYVTGKPYIKDFAPKPHQYNFLDAKWESI